MSAEVIKPPTDSTPIKINGELFDKSSLPPIKSGSTSNLGYRNLNIPKRIKVTTDKSVKLPTEKPVIIKQSESKMDKNQLKEKLMKHEIADTTYKRLAMTIKGDKKATFVILKADDKAKYKNIIDIIDELNVADVGKYALVDISPAEKEMLKVMGIIK